MMDDLETRFRALTNVAPNILWTAAPDGKILYANDEWLRYLGETPQANTTEWPEIPLHPEDAERYKAGWTQALLDGKDYETEVRQKRHDGEYRWKRTRAVPIRDSNGKVTGWCGCTDDIQDRKQLEAAIRDSDDRLYFANEIKYQTLFELAGIGNAQVDVKTGRFLRANRKLCEMLGYSETELQERTFSEITHPADQAKNLEQFKQMQQGDIDSYSLEKRYVRSDGSILWAQLNVAKVSNAQGEPLYLITNVQDITQRKQTESDFRFLSDLSETLIALNEPDDIISAVTQRLGQYLYAQRCYIEEVSENMDQIAIHEDYRVGGLSLRGIYPISTFPPKLLDELRAGQAVIVEDASTDPRFEGFYSTLYGSAGIRAFVALPQVREGQWLGSLYITNSHIHAWSEEAIAFLRSVAVRTWLALENARLYKAAQTARQLAERVADRTFRLQAVTAALSQALKPEHVMDVILKEGLVALDAVAGSVALPPPDRENDPSGVLLSSYPLSFSRALQQMSPEQRLPVKDVLSTGQPLWIESSEDRNARYPHMGDTYLGLGVGALAGVPMILNGKTLGALVFHFVGKRSFDIDDRNLLFTLATQCAQALERARPYEAEQTARAAADATARLWAYLARAGQTLAHSLDFNETLETAANVVIPYLADFSLIFVIEAGSVRGVAYAHQQSDKRADVQTFSQLFRPDSDSMDCPAAQVVLTGKSKLFDNWEDAQCMPTTPATQQAVDALTPRSMMLVPLTVRGRVAGVFALVSAESERHYTDADLTLAEEIGHRIALAAENARLYAEAQALSAELEGRVQTRTEQLRDSHDQLQLLSARLERLREEERTQIAREVHDELGGSLTSIKMGLVRLRKESAGGKPEWTERINELSGLIDSTVQTVRRIASDLRPAILDELGLLPALEWQAQEFERRTGLPCAFENSIPEDNELRLDKETATAIFRVFQESLTNIARHAQATRIEASVRRDGQELVLKIEDNGRGIETVDLNNSKSLGLAGMRERMRQVAGQLEIRGEKGEGTTVLIRIPLNLL